VARPSGWPKNVSFPTDAKLLHAATSGLNGLPRKHGVCQVRKVPNTEVSNGSATSPWAKYPLFCALLPTPVWHVVQPILALKDCPEAGRFPKIPAMLLEKQCYR